MPTLLESNTFLFMWTGFTVLMICCITGFFLWAVRSEQFEDQERARYLPLDDWLQQAGERPETVKQGQRSSP